MTQQSESSHKIPYWASELEKGDFVSYSPLYASEQYRQLFDEDTFENKEVGAITYYFYDPIKHGADPNGVYPLLMWFHGAGNALAGEVRVQYAGAEMYASPEYQKAMGGAYILVPFANEKRSEDGSLENSWDDEYLHPIQMLYEQICSKYKKNIGKKIVLGSSRGACFNWVFTAAVPENVDASIIISGSLVISDEQLDKIDKAGVQLVILHGRHDELVPFDTEILPHVGKFESLKHCICYFPEWVRYEDKGVASNNPSVEMGQHCIIN